MGKGKYTMPNGTVYEGEIVDGMFHGDGTLYFPEFGKYVAKWERGKALEGTYYFADGLEYNEGDWPYCTADDRRFYTEQLYGLKPAGQSQGTNAHPPPPVPAGAFDCNDGYLVPEEGKIYSYDGEFRRRPTLEEAQWIVDNCRIGVNTPAKAEGE
eukprot:GFYU01003288.1.p2 GENE.GFYU01003288.1~~GFYU01003288.1.p2  ORF type:complete len:155 (-),score=41.94 GFYU01003288.1:430-894(-)